MGLVLFSIEWLSFSFLILINKNIKETDDFEKEKINDGWEIDKLYERFLGVYTGLLSSDNISKEIDSLTKNIFD